MQISFVPVHAGIAIEIELRSRQPGLTCEAD
jgi:hypothetical protein